MRALSSSFFNQTPKRAAGFKKRRKVEAEAARGERIWTSLCGYIYEECGNNISCDSDDSDSDSYSGNDNDNSIGNNRKKLHSLHSGRKGRKGH